MNSNIRIYSMKKTSGGFANEFFRRISMTNLLIILNVASFIIFRIASIAYNEEVILSLFAIQGNSFFSGYLWTLLTSMFMHGSVYHLLFNMISLFFIGNFVEKLIGRKRFLWFYIISGVFAGFFYAVLSYYLGNLCIANFLGKCIGEKIFMNPDVFAVGASGAIFALLGLLALLTPYHKVYLIAGPLIAIIIQASFAEIFPNNPFISALDIFITIYFFVSVFSMFSFNPNFRRIAIPVEMQFWLLPIIAIVPLIAIGLFVTLPIGNTAHLGGLLAGFIYASYFKFRYKRKTELISRYFSR